MGEERRGVQERWIIGYGDEHGSNDALELRAEQIVLAGVVRVKRGAPDAGFLGDVADADVTITPTVQQFDEGHIDATARSHDALVFIPTRAFPIFGCAPAFSTRIAGAKAHVHPIRPHRDA